VLFCTTAKENLQVQYIDIHPIQKGAPHPR
jgi:hypothetical protein